MLRGIDVSSWQSGIDLSVVDADFVTVKATGGTAYVNPDFRRQADQALASGKLLAVYHFARERSCPDSAAEEAAHFLAHFAPYAGVAIPVLDWEADAVTLPVSWALEWLEAVSAGTGAQPWFYSYANYINATDCSAIAHFPLWIAAYYAGYRVMGYQADPPLLSGTGAWTHATCYQYTSSGQVAGWSGNLDLNIFYGDRALWESFIGGSRIMTEKIDLGAVAAQLHANMCMDERFGYSWAERYGSPERVTWPVAGRDYTLAVGDYDCSSSTITAWKKALEGTPYEGVLDGATYTGNMRSVFTGSGLFDWVDPSQARPGDLYLTEAQHVAMCQPNGKLSEFSRNEHGGAYGGQRGDQDGWESHITSYYGGWDGCLRYNGKADLVTRRKKGRKMECLIQPNGEARMVYFDGTTIHPLTHPDQMVAIQEVYRRCNGTDIPCFALGSKDAPWATRLFEAVGYKGGK